MPEPLNALLADHARRFPGERAVTEQFSAFLQEYADAFLRSCRIGHFTGSAWIVDPANEHVLLTHHRKLDRWLQPGGHADGETDLAAVALREADEETGLTDLRLVTPSIFDLDRHVIPARTSEPEHFHYDVRFLIRAEGDRRFTVSEESHDLAWVPFGELENYGVGESILRMARKSGDGRVTS